MKRSIVRKLILSVSSLAATAVCLTSTTFAWFAKNANAWTDPFDINVHTFEGLLVSLDGESFYQDVTAEELKASIAGTVENFDKKIFQGVTPKQQAGKVLINDGQVAFMYDDVDRKTHTHQFKDATSNADYLQFDLWFKAVSDRPTSELKLVMGEGTEITSKTEQIRLECGFTAGTTTYNAGDTITQSAKNAIRLGINDSENSFKIFEVTDSADIGSTAIEGGTDEHDPLNNVMFNYYNAVHVLEPFQQAAIPGAAYDTIKHYGTGTGEDWQGEYLTKFEANGITKVTVYIWLEGWDADYLLNTTVEGAQIGATLEFLLK